MKTIEWANLAYAFIPFLVIALVQRSWHIHNKTFLIASIRMIIQLLVIGFVLNFIFSKSDLLLSLSLIIVMIVAASWISLSPLKEGKLKFLPYSLISIFLGGSGILLFVMFIVLDLKSWHEPRIMLPLAGMIFANAMNGISLALDRYLHERTLSKSYSESRAIALKTALIPITNSFLAVGLVSLPGLMTGQILAGVDPMIAVRYQAAIMCMVYSSNALSVIVFLNCIRNKF